MEPIKDRIRKLLALAAGGTENEAALALQHAQRLMDLHRISEIEIEVADPGKREQIVQDPNPLFKSGRIPNWKIDLAHTLARYNNCKTLKFMCDRKHGIKDSQIVLFGKPSNCETVHYLLAFIVVQLTRISKIACMGEGHRYYDSWYRGAVAGISSKLAVSRKEVFEEVTNKMLLVKFEDDLADVDKFMKDKFKVTFAKRAESNINYDAYNSGYKSGKNADFGESKTIKQNKTLGG